MSLRLTQASDYAILAMIHMACLPENSVALRAQIVKSCDIPPSFAAKILRSLVRAGLLQSTRGARGGFRLARPASEISVLDIIESTEGPLALARCVEAPCSCEMAEECPVQPVWVGVQAKLAEVLRGEILEDLVSAPRRRAAVLVPVTAVGALAPARKPGPPRR